MHLLLSLNKYERFCDICTYLNFGFLWFKQHFAFPKQDLVHKQGQTSECNVTNKFIIDYAFQ